MIKVKAGDLAEALKPAKPHPLKKRPKPVPVSLEQDFVSGAFSVIEAKNGAFAKAVPGSGDWPRPVQVEGILLQKLVATWAPETELELSADAEALTIRAGKSTSRVTRIDGGGANLIVRTPRKPDERHAGKVIVPPDPTNKRVELADTWGFSARVPMPQHRDPKDKG
jgi:hypothetical protein